MPKINIPIIKYYLKSSGESLLSLSLTRYIFAIGCLLFNFVFRHIIPRHYLAIKVMLKCQKILSEFNPGLPYNIVESYCRKLNEYDCKNILHSFRDSTISKKYKTEFLRYGKRYASRLKYPRTNDNESRQGDLLLLKPYLGDNEKGVLLIKYNDSFEKFISLFDIDQISQRYRIVLEPSTWGYQDVVFSLFRPLNTDIIIQSQCQQDFEYIESLGGNLWPIHIGAGDWTDLDLFMINTTKKKYDIIMVASWQLLKRHRLLFDTLATIKSSISKVCLVGYPAEGRTLDDVKADAKRRGVLDIIDFFENISPKDVAGKICMSKVSIMLTKREGASKVVYESLFCNVPVLISSTNRGVNRNIINPQTGVMSSDLDLGFNIAHTIKSYRNFSPRDWAIKNTGYLRSHEILNHFVREISITKGENWTQDLFMKKNIPNLIYANDTDRLIANNEFSKLENLLITN